MDDSNYTSTILFTCLNQQNINTSQTDYAILSNNSIEKEHIDFVEESHNEERRKKETPVAVVPKIKPRQASKRATSSQAVDKNSSKSELKTNDDKIESMFNLNLNDRVFALNTKGHYVPAIITEITKMETEGYRVNDVLFKCSFLDMEKASDEPPSKNDHDQFEDDYEYYVENYERLNASRLIPANILEEGDRLTVYRKNSYKAGYFEAYCYGQSAKTDKTVEMFCVKLNSRLASIRFSFRHVSIKKQDSYHIMKRWLAAIRRN